MRRGKKNSISEISSVHFSSSPATSQSGSRSKWGTDMALSPAEPRTGSVPVPAGILPSVIPSANLQPLSERTTGHMARSASAAPGRADSPLLVVGSPNRIRRGIKLPESPPSSPRRSRTSSPHASPPHAVVHPRQNRGLAATPASAADHKSEASAMDTSANSSDSYSLSPQHPTNGNR